MKANGAVIALDRNRKTITGVKAQQPGESVWRLIERVAAKLANSDEIGGDLARYESPEDPLGYDTTDPGYLLQMARDALCGRGIIVPKKSLRNRRQ
ncbi:hypothetical protein [Bradyrhizobium sp.]